MKPKLARTAGWVLLAAAFAAGSLAPIVAPGSGSEALGMLLYLVPLALAVPLGVECANKAFGTERRFWTFVVVAVSLLFVSELWWSWRVLVVDPHGGQLPQWFEIPQALAAFFFLAMVLSLTEFGQDPLPSRMRLYVEVVSAFVVSFALVYAWWTFALFHDLLKGGHASGVIAAVYPVFGSFMLLSVVTVLWHRGRWQMWQALLSASLLIYSIGLLVWPAWYADFLAQPDPQSGGVFAAVGGLGYGLLCLSMVYRLTDRSRSTIVPRMFPRWRSVAAAAGYSAFLGVAILALMLAGFTAEDQFMSQTMYACALIVSLLAASRSMLVSVERAYDTQRATEDPVSGLPGFVAMHVAVQRAVTRAQGAEGTFSLVIVDPIGFKQVNEAQGTVVGDAVIRELSERLVESFSGTGEVYRADSDAFVVVLQSTDQTAALGLATIASDFIDRTVQVGGFRVRVSAGVASYPEDGETAPELLANLGRALAAARFLGRPALRTETPQLVVDDERRVQQVRTQAHVAAVRALAAAIEQREARASGHGAACADLSRRLAQVLALDADRIHRLGIAAELHDVGKVGVADRVLSKPSTLESDEYEAVEEHAVLGERIVAAAGMPDVASWIRSHHERWDGEGYPDGLKGEQIPLESRILHVAAAFEAMTSPRSWREALSLDAAVAEVRRNAGTQFDPQLADVFCRLLEGMQGAPAPLTLEWLGVSEPS